MPSTAAVCPAATRGGGRADIQDGLDEFVDDFSHRLHLRRSQLVVVSARWYDHGGRRIRGAPQLTPHEFDENLPNRDIILVEKARQGAFVGGVHPFVPLFCIRSRRQNGTPEPHGRHRRSLMPPERQDFDPLLRFLEILRDLQADCHAGLQATVFLPVPCLGRGCCGRHAAGGRHECLHGQPRHGARADHAGALPPRVAQRRRCNLGLRRWPGRSAQFPRQACTPRRPRRSAHRGEDEARHGGPKARRGQRRTESGRVSRQVELAQHGVQG
mmetsp:Transcript_121858/g.389692  ORF Transcript_121858/g.389692 Transcript_121858/m.389692 type:complete len:271 (-) Transcript_121858:696-1508(-)